MLKIQNPVEYRATDLTSQEQSKLLVCHDAILKLCTIIKIIFIKVIIER